MKVVIPVSLNTETDSDILNVLEQASNRSAFIRDAIRFYQQHGAGLAASDIYQKLEQIERKIDQAQFAARQDGQPPNQEEPPTAAANLDALLGL